MWPRLPREIATPSGRATAGLGNDATFILVVTGHWKQFQAEHGMMYRGTSWPRHSSDSPACRLSGASARHIVAAPLRCAQEQGHTDDSEHTVAAMRCRTSPPARLLGRSSLGLEISDGARHRHTLDDLARVPVRVLTKDDHLPEHRPAGRDDEFIVEINAGTRYFDHRREHAAPIGERDDRGAGGPAPAEMRRPCAAGCATGRRFAVRWPRRHQHRHGGDRILPCTRVLGCTTICPYLRVVDSSGLSPGHHDGRFGTDVPRAGAGPTPGSPASA